MKKERVMMDEELKNGNANLDKLRAKTGDPRVVKVLEDALSEARAGLITTVAVIKVAQNGNVGIVSAGEQGAGLICGLEHLKNQMLAIMFAPRPASGLVVPGRP